MEKEILNSTKPRLNICTIGHVDHGKTKLTAALATMFAGQVNIYDHINKNSVENALSIEATYIEYETANYQVYHVDCARHIDHFKYLLAGTTQPDAVILVCSVTEGPMPQTLEHLELVAQMGVPNIIIFLNKIDLIEPEESEIVEMDVRDLVLSYDFWQDYFDLINGSSLLACMEDALAQTKIVQLTNAIDKFPTPQQDTDKSFLMPIEDVINVSEGNAKIVGKIETGRITLNDEVAVVTAASGVIPAVVAGIDTAQRQLNEAKAYDEVSILLQGINKAQIQRGDIILLAKENNNYIFGTKFRAIIYVLQKEEGGRHTPFFQNYRPQCFLWNKEINGSISFEDSIFASSVEMGKPGDILTIAIELSHPTVLYQGLRFSIRENGRTVIVGVVTKVLSS
jgi:elongation factor Tu